MSVQRKLLLGFGLMLVPVLMVTAAAIRANGLERRAVESLGRGMARTRTYSELEAALQAQGEVVWRGLSGFDSGARREYQVSGDAVNYWEQQWQSELRPEEASLAQRLTVVRRQLDRVADSIFTLTERDHREEAWALAQSDLRANVLPAVAQVSHDIYGQLRQTSVRAAFTQIEGILVTERRTLFVILAIALTLGLSASWLIARGLGRPIASLRDAMAVVGSGTLDAPIPRVGRDEIGQLAQSFAQMRDNLREAQVRLVQSEKLASIGEMSAAVAHGLRNPLAGLRASAQLAMSQRPDSPAFAETLSGMIEEVDRLDRRITHLLSFSRPAPYHPIAERLAAIVRDVLPTFGEQFRESAIVLEQRIAADLPDIRVDPMQVEQVIVELLSNAMHAMPQGGTLTVAAHAAPLTNGRTEVVVEISDTGVGIPPATLAHVCEPFFTTRAEGTGLGLAIARRFVEQNGGTLTVESTVGSGTTVRLRLPTAGAAVSLSAGATA
jgi:signal transduction histidine kinase